MTPNNPLISIIIATYNCSHLLKYAIKSVLNSTYNNWELIIIGDCCTDDTESCVANFEDKRIRFVNLKENSGQQAKPNNVGVTLAKGKYVAFLNQDDMYFADHLSLCVTHMENNDDAEVICVPGVQILPGASEDLNFDKFKAVIVGVHPNGRYSPFENSVASLWFLRKASLYKVGEWKTENSLYVPPSQEWLFRAWKKGLKFHFPEYTGVLIIYSAERKNSYLQKSSYEHEYFINQLNDPIIKIKLLEQSAIFSSNLCHVLLYQKPLRHLLRAGAYPFYKLLEKLSIHPNSLNMFLRWGGKGKFISYARKKTGLAEIQ